MGMKSIVNLLFITYVSLMLHLSKCLRMQSTSTLVSSYTILTEDMMAGLMSRVKENNDISEQQLKTFIPFKIKGEIYGYCSSSFAQHLLEFQDVFVSQISDCERLSLHLKPSLETSPLHDRTTAVGLVTASLRDAGIISGWRNELFPVVNSFSSPPALLLERAAYPLFGVKAYGVHVNGFVRGSTGKIEKLWVATRSATKSTWPGMRDCMVAGGVAHGYSPSETAIKECGEEANIPLEIAQRAVPVSAISYRGRDESGNLKRDSIFIFDLELPKSFVPTPVDGEVDSFELKDIEWVLERVIQGGPKGYKPNCYLVVMDFLVRHGFIAPESPGYLKLLAALRGGDCV